MNKKLLELLDQINAAKAEVKSLAAEGKLEEAKAKKEELVSMQAKFDLLKDLEDEGPENPRPVNDENAIHAFAQAARNRFRNEGEMKEGTPEDGGYTVPEDIQTRINQYREARFSLRKLVSVENVSTMSGARTYQKRADHTGFKTVAEAGKIEAVKGPQFERIEYTIEKRGGYLPVTNELLADSDAAISGLLISWLGDESEATDNANILKTIKEGGFEKVENCDSIDQIKEIIDVKLGQAFANTATIVTNDDGLYWLDTLKDKNDRYLLSPNIDPANPMNLYLAVGARRVPVVVVPNGVLASEETGKFPLIIGDLKEAVRIFDRQRISIMTSNVAVAGDFNAFEQDMTLFRGILRNDYVVLDTKSAVYATHSPKG